MGGRSQAGHYSRVLAPVPAQVLEHPPTSATPHPCAGKVCNGDDKEGVLTFPAFENPFCLCQPSLMSLTVHGQHYRCISWGLAFTWSNVDSEDSSE